MSHFRHLKITVSNKGDFGEFDYELLKIEHLINIESIDALIRNFNGPVDF